MNSSDDLEGQLGSERCRRFLAHVYPRTMSEEELALLGQQLGPDVARSNRKKRDKAVKQQLTAAMVLLSEGWMNPTLSNGDSTLEIALRAMSIKAQRPIVVLKFPEGYPKVTLPEDGKQLAVALKREASKVPNIECKVTCPVLWDNEFGPMTFIQCDSKTAPAILHPKPTALFEDGNQLSEKKQTELLFQLLPNFLAKQLAEK